MIDQETLEAFEAVEARRLIARINRQLRPESMVRTSRGARMIQTGGTWYLHDLQHNIVDLYLPSIHDLRALAAEVGC